MDGGTKFFPSRDIGREPARFRRFNQAIDSDPGHQFGMDEMTSRTAHLPDTFVGLLPPGLEKIEHRESHLTAPVLNRRQACFARLMKRVDYFSKNIQLILLISGISGSHRSRVLVPRKPRQFEFGEPAF